MTYMNKSQIILEMFNKKINNILFNEVVTITRLDNFNKESDIVVYLMNKLEQLNVNEVSTIYQKAFNNLLPNPTLARIAIEPYCLKFIKSIELEFKQYVTTKVDKFMLVNDPKFITMASKVFAQGIVNELVENPTSYRKYLTKEQQIKVDDDSILRGKNKFNTMTNNMKK